MGNEVMINEIACSECGGNEYLYVGDSMLGRYKFRGYQCMRCKNEIALDEKAILGFVELESKKRLPSYNNVRFLGNNV